ncbi:serine hydrolase domain-containing protein [Chryseobacterium populi]|uniref:Penicillin-binding protein, beta-lactamase class C n=1 Tax=Chryseobacterium populi TaxID=1144316 RepID=J2K9C8_9FLAO|nr:serine hydrolase domain-containing protein [Chryseobacterium populi]EJL69828.1 penicillin-binding protein, beta-lactamase class C [Chryseobacterium populi]
MQTKNQKNIIIKLSILIVFLSISYSYGQYKKDYIHRIDSLIKAKSPRPFNGVVLITKNGGNKYFKASGFENSRTKTPLKTDDQFEIMSNTKQITSVLLLKEVEKGKVNLQAPIKKYLPFLTQPWADSVTVHQLLNHTHGISDINKPLLFRPGTDFKYGNLSNILLGKIIETTSGRSYTEMADELFRKLNMKNTFCYSKTDRRNLVYGHINKENTFTPVEESFINDENLPADGVITTAADLSVWNNQLHKGKILNPESYRLMTAETVQSQHDVFGKDKMGYGYNIRIVKDNGIRYLGHTGLGDGFASLNVYIPDSDVSIIVLENQMSEDSSLYYYFETLIKNIVLKSSLISSKP